MAPKVNQNTSLGHWVSHQNTFEFTILAMSYRQESLFDKRLVLMSTFGFWQQQISSRPPFSQPSIHPFKKTPIVYQLCSEHCAENWRYRKKSDITSLQDLLGPRSGRWAIALVILPFHSLSNIQPRSPISNCMWMQESFRKKHPPFSLRKF